MGVKRQDVSQNPMQSKKYRTLYARHIEEGEEAEYMDMKFGKSSGYSRESGDVEMAMGE